MDKYENKSTPYIVFFALFIGILTPALFSDGMFTDGIMYADISRYLAEGNGSFWHLHFSDTLASYFIGHPPLAFFLTSIGYKIFGDSFLIERIYSLLTGFAAAGLIIFILKEFITNSKRIQIISLFVWLSFPLVNWTYANNMLENTMTVFSLFSSYFVFQSFKKKRILMLFFAGLSLFAASMSKGMPALFVWSIIFFYWLIYKKISFRKMLSDSILLVLFTIIPFAVLILFSNEASIFFKTYFSKQLLGSIENVKTVSNRIYIIKSMLNEMIIPAVLIILLFIISKLKKRKLFFAKENMKNSLFFFLIALSGILPIMISMKQRSFYIVPALPFLAISFAFIINDLLKKFPEILTFFQRKIFKPISFVLLGLSFVMIFIFANKTGRDFNKVSDVHELLKVIPEGDTVSICKAMQKDWSLYAYMQRYGKYNLTTNLNGNWFLSENNCISDTCFQKVDLNLKKYILYKKTDDGRQN